MKKFFYFALVCLCLFSCINYNNQSTTKVEKPYKAVALVDTVVSLYPNLYVNDIQKERFLAFLRLELDKQLTEDNNYLSEIPVKFSKMLKKGSNKYVLKFEAGSFVSTDKRLSSAKSKTEIDFAIFAEVDADFASTLEEGALYTLTGKYKGYVDNKLKLLGGQVFEYPTHCYKGITYGSVCLGGFLFTNINVTKK